MIDFFLVAFLAVMLIIVSILEYKQNMNRIEFEEKIAKMRAGILDDANKENDDQ